MRWTVVLEIRLIVPIFFAIVYTTLVGGELSCRCPANETDGFSGCCGDEELLLGLCYKKCETLTSGRFPFRFGSNTCCNSPNFADCLLFMNTETQGFGCFGYGVGADGGCADYPCQYTERKNKFVGGSVVGRWAYHLTFNIPTTDQWGPIASIDGGNCTHLVIGDMRATDFTSGDVPEVGYQVSGISIQCRLLASQRSLTVNFGFSDSSVYLRLAVYPKTTQEAKVQLPFGKVILKSCEAKASLAYLDFGGTSALWPGLKALREDIIKVVRKDAGRMACSRMEPLVVEHASKFLGNLADEVDQYFTDSDLTNQDGALRPQGHAPSLVEWDEYPPVLFLQALLKERRKATDKVAQRLPVINIPVDRTFSNTKRSVTAGLTIKGLQLEGLDTFVTEALQIAGNDEQIHFEMAFRRIRASISATVRLEAESHKDVEFYGQGPLQKDLNLTVDIGNASLAFSVQALMSASRLDALGVDQMQQFACLASCASTGVLPAGMPIRIERAIVGTTPDVQVAVLGDLEKDVAETIDATVIALLKAYMPSLEKLVPLAAERLRPQFLLAVDDYVEDMPTCKPTNVYKGPSPALRALLLWPSALLTVSSLLFGIYWIREVREKDNVPSTRGTDSLSTRVALISDKFPVRPDSPKNDAADDAPLSAHPVVPTAGRLMCLSMLAAATLLFVYADSDLGTIINLVISAGGRSVTIGPAFAFSMGTCIRDAINAGAWIFAIIVAGLSGVWPLTKLSLILLCWVAPTSALTRVGRERLLRFLDEYGKYSLIDSWLTILALEAYRIEWRSMEGDISVMVDAVPQAAFFCFVAASVFSLFVGHATSIFAKVASDSDLGLISDVACDETPISARLCDYAPRGSAIAVLISLVCTCVAVVVGTWSASFAVTTSGVLSAVMLDPVEETRPYSLYSLGVAVTSGKTVHAGSLMVQIIFFFFAFVTPLVLVASLIMLWMVPFGLQTQKRLLVACRCLDAWAAFDVFGLAVLVAWLEFGRMASFLIYHDNIGPLCGWVRDNLQRECFHIEAELLPGFFALAVGGIASYLAPKQVFVVCQRALDVRESEMDGSKTWPMKFDWLVWKGEDSTDGDNDDEADFDDDDSSF